MLPLRQYKWLLPITLGSNAASFLSEKEIKNIEKPYFADDDKIREHSLYLSACQFNREEFRNGYAVKMIEQLQHDQKYYRFKYKCQLNFLYQI